MKKAFLTLAVALPAALLASCQSCPFIPGNNTTEIVLCDGCGVEKGSKGCCDADAARCGDCGKIKGSDGCCN